ncbi:MAG: HD domain-containing protein [Bacteroidales bacterium]|nr:MAG: HD domain-containing protein [Bacteroidales bacterium]
MKYTPVNKRKIINDPVHGFIKIPSTFIYDIIEHPAFQRLRRIKQLGLTSYVYPGATHSRFQHALGAAHLMGMAIQNIRLKGLKITEKEAEAATIAILLHDIGHGPFSHALEQSIIENFSHEDVSRLLMDKLNEEFKGKLDLALKIFSNKYHKKFLHQLVSSQLDMDRLDYLKRDSFYTGVSEGVIGSDRIIKMLNVVDDNLVVEAKGIYSIEDFLIARRLMFWQVYLHKTVLAAENLVARVLQRAKYVAGHDNNLFAVNGLKYFFKNNITRKNLYSKKEDIISNFVNLDDNDIITSTKVWINHPDKVLSILSDNLINRKLPKIIMQDQPFAKNVIDRKIKESIRTHNWNDEDIGYFIFTGSISNKAYSELDDKIKILYNTGETRDIVDASDIFNVSVLSKIVKKYFLCYPGSLL